jgi:predicted membrane protein
VPLDSSGPLYINASVAIGELDVLVPNDLPLWSVEAKAGVGNAEVFGTQHDGVHPRVFVDTHQLPAGGADQGNIVVLRVRVGAGDVEVHHVAR